ncbi:uncharacterized protein LOC133844111 isoform X2 [Drosophila sulfurigaster albostrigata]|uniref:uncharacterized protein LOC133844111 isoform X2 n=1 Tax=Drosophila sulfurigaster albostrigata TaxID=89887 RepID=UPI002D21929D|nr:uncharacterized protein LOC133844111 isoform X2 [Drosophila sulfurigaster albostrigata]
MSSTSINSDAGGSKMAVAVTTAKPATPSPSLKVYDFDFAGTKFEMDASVSEEERRFYLKMYPTVDVVNQRKVHCTVCRSHLGTAPSTESNIKMHPILRVTHCVKCHDFYNSGEFSKGEDGSELYCRWCGQGGEVYCCSTCPFVFCKSCIIKNLSRGVIVDIEQNENWNCFRCTPKILWPLRAQHWALINYIETQKNGLQAMPLSGDEMRRLMNKDSSSCCRLAKAKANSLSDSMESLESNASKRSHNSSITSVKKYSKPQGPPAKRPKSSNDEVVCTPDLLSMLEPDCQISVAQKSSPRTVPSASSGTTITTTPRITSVQQNYTGPSPSSSGSNNNNSNGNSSVAPRSSLPPPLVLSSSGMRYRQSTPISSPVVRRTVVPNAVRSAGPVFHTINGFRVDLNTAAQQDSYRLPNGRLIQVKRQVPLGGQPSTSLSSAPMPVTPQVIIRQRLAAPQRMMHNNPSYGSNIGIYNPQTNPQQQPRTSQIVRVNNGSQMQSVNMPTPPAPAANSNGGTTIMMTPAAAAKPQPSLVRHVFPNTSIGTARTQLQEQIFNAMEICTHLTGKVQTLTHSNAYNQARSYMDLKELYIHLSYLMTYAIGRFKQLQEKCLVDMREMGFKNDANSLENGQLAAEKQASDDEDNEIEIVEPKTDTITIDSDNEEERPSTSAQSPSKGLKITAVKSTAPEPELPKADPVTAIIDPAMDIDVNAFSSSILASLLEVDITEGVAEVKTKSSPGGAVQKKQPRKKTTNKPNPALLHLERQRMEEIKMNDAKLKMRVAVKLRRAEDEFEVARLWIEEQKKLSKESQGSIDDTEKQSENVDGMEPMPSKDESDIASKDASEVDHINLDGNEDMNRSRDPENNNSENPDVNTEEPRIVADNQISTDFNSIIDENEVMAEINKNSSTIETKEQTKTAETQNDKTDSVIENHSNEDKESEKLNGDTIGITENSTMESNELNSSNIVESDNILAIVTDSDKVESHVDSPEPACTEVDKSATIQTASEDSSKTDAILSAEEEIENDKNSGEFKKTESETKSVIEPTEVTSTQHTEAEPNKISSTVDELLLTELPDNESEVRQIPQSDSNVEAF